MTGFSRVFYYLNYFFLKSYVTSEGAVSHNINFQQLSFARYQVSLYAYTILLSNYQ